MIKNESQDTLTISYTGMEIIIKLPKFLMIAWPLIFVHGTIYIKFKPFYAITEWEAKFLLPIKRKKNGDQNLNTIQKSEMGLTYQYHLIGVFLVGRMHYIRNTRNLPF